MTPGATKDAEIAVIGMGYVGMAAALSLADAGHAVLAIGLDETDLVPSDTRSTALFPQSRALLEEIGVWDAIASESRPLAGIRIVDQTNTLLRAPEMVFDAEDIGIDALATNVPNAALQAALQKRLLQHPGIRVLRSGPAKEITHGPDAITIETENGTSCSARMIVAADGRNSMARSASGIAVRSWAYDQTALACAFAHSADHHDISTEFHRPAGPFTTVPGSRTDDGYTSHIVWIETPNQAARLAELDDQAFTSRLEEHLQGLLGNVTRVEPRGSFPIRGQTARTFAAQNTFLVGEAAHVLPPIGAQGMNLGLRDVSGLVRVLEETTGETGMTNPEEAMRLYNEDRRSDVWLRTTAVDLLNRSLTTPHLPMQMLRGAGLHALNMLPGLKRVVVRAGFGN